MEETFLAHLAERFEFRKKALVGVSGGIDSVVLLDLLRRAGFRHLVVCHLDHSMRGPYSAADAAFVRRLAIGADLPFEVGKADVVGLAEAESLSIETAARVARHSFFATAAKRHRCRRVFLAHHADDQVETVLHQVCRGSGLRGLSGMRECTSIEVKLGGDRMVSLQMLRPLLGIWREEIANHAATHRLKFRDDASNEDREISTRNRWRHDLLPTIRETLGRDPGPAVARLAEIARAEDEAVESHLDGLWPELVSGEGGDRLRLAGLRSLPVAWQRRLLRRWLEAASVPGIGFELVERVRAILPSRGAAAAKVNLPGGGWVRRRAGQLFLEWE